MPVHDAFSKIILRARLLEKSPWKGRQRQSFASLGINGSLNLSDPTLLQTTSFINGSFSAPTQPADLPVINPYDGSVVACLHGVSSSEIDAALRSASRGLDLWRRTPSLERASVLKRLLSLLDTHTPDLAKIIVAENGKPHKEALAEVAYATPYIAQVLSTVHTASHGTRCAEISPSTLSMLLREPIGVVLAVTPWNFPLAMLARKLAPALAAGCPVVAKPSEQTPLSSLALAELARRAGVPPGVLSVLVTADARRACEAALAHRDVRMLSFTGSTAVGRALAATAARRVQRTAMELGGLAPFVVCEDADVRAAVDGLMRNKFRNSGQSCVSANRVLVHRGIAREFVALLARRMREEVVLGRGTQPSATVGPLINRAAVARVRGQMEDAVSRGARVACQVAVPAGEDEAVFFPPTLLVDVPDEAECFRVETFGPLIAVQLFDDVNVAVAKANSTEMGLAGYVYSKCLKTATSVARSLQVGMVGVNDVSITDSRTCFGGVKQSGGGREGSEFQLDDYTEAKYVYLNHGDATDAAS